jgi:tetratricopeptide (TPR) repeat protein
MRTSFAAKLSAITLCLALSPAASAASRAIADANAALATLQSGDNDGAITLFTRALGEGLRGDDKEFAYAMRGKAYLNKGDLFSAINDLDTARQLKPDDGDAQKDLILAICKVQPASLIAGRSASSYANQFGNALGRALLGGLAQGLQQQTGANVSVPTTAGQELGCQ